MASHPVRQGLSNFESISWRTNNKCSITRTCKSFRDIGQVYLESSWLWEFPSEQATGTAARYMTPIVSAT